MKETTVEGLIRKGQALDTILQAVADLGLKLPRKPRVKSKKKAAPAAPKKSHHKKKPTKPAPVEVDDDDVEEDDDE